MYIGDITLSIFLGCLVFMLVEKLVTNIVASSQYDEGLQKKFVLSFIIGIAFVILGTELLGKQRLFENNVVQNALYGASIFLILNGTLFNWGKLDEGTKMVIICIAIIGVIMYTYYRNGNKKDD